MSEKHYCPDCEYELEIRTGTVNGKYYGKQQYFCTWCIGVGDKPHKGWLHEQDQPIKSGRRNTWGTHEGTLKTALKYTREKVRELERKLAENQ